MRLFLRDASNMGSSRANGPPQTERLADDPNNAHHGDYERIYVETLRARWEAGGEGAGVRVGKSRGKWVRRSPNTLMWKGIRQQATNW